MSTVISDYLQIWENALAELKTSLGESDFNMWFKDISCSGIENDTIQLIAPNSMTEIWVEGNFKELLSRALSLAAGYNLAFSMTAPADSGIASPQRKANALPVTPAEPKQPVVPPRTLCPSIRSQNTFESFIKGSENEMAVSGAMSIVENLTDADTFNPLFIYGPSGVGKTHLLHAIANAVFAKKPDANISYVTCETFINDFVESIKSGKLEKFRRHYRNLNLLLVDDIQFLEAKEKMQEEFFHTFNHLCTNGCKVVLTSDRAANDVKIEDRLLSRFQQGFSADIQPPCLETRLAILTKKAEARGFDFAKFPNVLDYVAQHITRNVRNLEGAVNTLVGYVKLRKCDTLPIKDVESILGNFIRQEESSQISVELIQQRVAESYGIDVQKMIARGRVANVAFARQVAMYLCCELTDMKLVAIGEAFGGRDHGTVIHARRTVQDRIDTTPADKRKIENLKSKLAQLRA